MYRVHIKNVQHISDLVFETDMNQGGLTCLVGKNGSGKTTLIRAIKNMISADTFSKTASPYIFGPESNITYQIDGAEYNFEYNPELNVVDTRNPVPRNIRESIEVELPIPDGIRFNHFRKLSGVDESLRSGVSLKNYSKPQKLINFLNSIYGPEKFDQLREVTVGKESYYLIPKDDDFYIREDYLSSGEYFLIHLYKLIQKGRNLIVIDEIDISLDASAQANLVALLRTFSAETQTRIVFTTHSMALMKTLKSDELQLMSENDGVVTVEPASYNYVKSILFGFIGWDKFILTEDILLEKYIHYLLDSVEGIQFSRFKIIHVGVARSVIKLMEKNDQEGFLGDAEDVICLLDGDQKSSKDKKDKKNKGNTRIFLLPFHHIEAQLLELAKAGHNELPLPRGGKSKNYYEYVIKKNILTQTEIFELVTKSKEGEIDFLKQRLCDHVALLPAN